MALLAGMLTARLRLHQKLALEAEPAGYPEFRAQNPRLEIPDISTFGQGGTRCPCAGRGGSAENSPFRGILTANKLSKFREKEPGRGDAGTTRT
jgi:hypothetical protein